MARTPTAVLRVPGTPTGVGGISHVFTAALTFMLVEDGLVALDDPVSRHVTRVPVDPRVTVRDLLQHSSGIPDYARTPVFDARHRADPGRVWTPAETHDLVRGDDLLFAPGTHQQYSDTNYLLLGILVEEVTGNDFVHELRRRILDPLDLDDTYLAGSEAGPDPFTGHTLEYGPLRPVQSPYTAVATDAWAAGALVSTAHDLDTFFDGLAGGRILGPAALATMTGEGDGDLHPDLKLGLTRWRDPPGVWSAAGTIPGYVTEVVHCPADGTTAFWALTNDALDLDGLVRPVVDRLGPGCQDPGVGGGT